MRNILKFKLVCKDDVIAKYLSEGKEYEINYSTIKPYWFYASKADVESVRATLLDGDNLLFILITASGQGGVIFIWDTKAHKVIHVSEGAYAVAGAVYNDKVYAFRDVHHWGIEPYTAISEIGIETMDTYTEYEWERLNINDYHGGKTYLHVGPDGRKVSFADKEYLV